MQDADAMGTRPAPCRPDCPPHRTGIGTGAGCATAGIGLTPGGLGPRPALTALPQGQQHLSRPPEFCSNNCRRLASQRGGIFLCNGSPSGQLMATEATNPQKESDCGGLIQVSLTIPPKAH